MLYLVLPFVISQSQPFSGGLDLGTAILAYGVAAPFAGICVWQLVKAERRADKAELRAEKRDEELLRLIGELSPLVSEATHVLDKVQASMSEQVSAVQGTVNRNEWDFVARRLEAAANGLVDEVRELRTERRQREEKD